MRVYIRTVVLLLDMICQGFRNKSRTLCLHLAAFYLNTIRSALSGNCLHPLYANQIGIVVCGNYLAPFYTSRISSRLFTNYSRLVGPNVEVVCLNIAVSVCCIRSSLSRPNMELFYLQAVLGSSICPLSPIC